MMSEVFFQDLEIPRPDVHLNVGSASHGVQTGRMLAELEPVIAEAQPDWVLVYGDTNSTLAGALAAVMIHQRVAHLKAGLRSLNRDMPEEINRVLTDHAEYRELSESDLPGAKVIFDCRGILAPSRFPAARYLRAGGGASADSDLAAAFANAKLATDA